MEFNEIRDLTGAKFKQALKRFISYESFSYKKVIVQLLDNGSVECRMQASVKPETISEELALAELRHIDFVFNELKSNAPKFLEMMLAKAVRFQLVHDHGRGYSDIAHLVNNEIVWDLRR